MIIRNSTDLIALRNYSAENESKLQNSIRKMASGVSVMKASDDSVKMSISERMRSQIRGLEQASMNIQDGISLLQTLDSGYEHISDLLNRMSELTIKASNGVLSADDLEKIENEFQECKAEIDRVAVSTAFNGRPLLQYTREKFSYATEFNWKGSSSSYAAEVGKIDLSTVCDGNALIINHDGRVFCFEFDEDGKYENAGAIIVDITNLKTNDEKAATIKSQIEAYTGLRAMIYSGETSVRRIQVAARNRNEGETINISGYSGADVFHVGANINDEISITSKVMSVEKLELKDASVSSFSKANEALKKINQAMDIVSERRTDCGVLQNRLEYTLARITLELENTASSKSRMIDVDMASEMVKLTKRKILEESIGSMMSHSMNNRQNIMQLINGRTN